MNKASSQSALECLTQYFHTYAVLGSTILFLKPCHGSSKIKAFFTLHFGHWLLLLSPCNSMPDNVLPKTTCFTLLSSPFQEGNEISQNKLIFHKMS